MGVSWKKVICSRKELQLLGTLNGGQSFRWQKHISNDEPKEQWIGIVRNRVWILAQTDNSILYKVYGSTKTNENAVDDDDEKLLRRYFQLDIEIQSFYKIWCQKDIHFEKAAEQFYGIRMLAQDPVENLFSFICSQNNNISRITSLVEKLCTNYGTKICELDGKDYYTFPTVEKLAGSKIEAELRSAAFGYRAKYISQSAQQIVKLGGLKWFDELKEMDYKEAKDQLCKLTGIGAKVADCICLMSLGHLEAIPVDTHVFQIATAFYLPHLAKNKTVTDRIYNEIGEHFRNLFGPMAGWAHTVLFCADLKKFKEIPAVDKTKGPPKKRKKK